MGTKPLPLCLPLVAVGGGRKDFFEENCRIVVVVV